ncbi:MAG: hypothetical protein POH28_03515 [Acidocella sp.]|nr:hypothetical protein [Acidocella sp.]
MKIFAVLIALTLAAPVMAVAAPAQTVAQKVAQTYHTSFPGVAQNANGN